MLKHRFEIRLHNGSVYAIAEHDSFRLGFRNIVETLFECLRNGVSDQVTLAHINNDDEPDERIWKKFL